MKKIIVVLTLFMLVIACNRKKQDEHKQHQKETVFYTCSMDPQVKEDKPGKCPICHMELVPMKNSADTPNEIRLSEQQIKLGNITTQTISETQNNMMQNFTGILALNQEKINTVASRAMGRIEKLFFKSEGDYVSAKSPVYVLYSEDIAVAKQDYSMAYQQLSMPGEFGKNAANIVKAAEQKLLFYGLSHTQIGNLKKNKDVSPYTTFYSNHSGYISEIAATEGSYVMEGAPVLRLSDLSPIWLEVQINVNYVQNLHIGQQVTVSFTDFPSRKTHSKIIFINPEINSNTRLLNVRLEIPNGDFSLKPGMQAIAQITLPYPKGIFIPSDAVIRDQNASYIWIEKSPGVFENLMVETGAEINGLIEIISEIDTSKKVVVTGAYAINSEYKFRKGSDPMEGHKM